MSGSNAVPSGRKPSVEIRRSRSSWSLSDAQSAASISRMVSPAKALSRPASSDFGVERLPRRSLAKAGWAFNLGLMHDTFRIRRATAQDADIVAWHRGRRGIAAVLITDIISWSRDAHLDRLLLQAPDEGCSLYVRLGLSAGNFPYTALYRSVELRRS